MKKIYGLIIIILTLTLRISVNAQASIESSIENGNYINNNGITISKENYNKMKDYFDENEIQNMNNHVYNMINDSIKVVAKETLYVETKYLNVYNDAFVLEQNIISKEEFDKKSVASIQSSVPPISTDYKYIELIVTDLGSKNYAFGLYNTWKKMPAYRSFDILAMRWNDAVTVNVTSIKGFQDYKKNGILDTVNYPYTSNNFEIFVKKGVGLSQNLVNNATYYYQGLYLTAKCSGTVELYATYQHAQADITEAESQMYTIGSGGMGNVLVFATQAIANVYDNTPGLSTSFKA